MKDKIQDISIFLLLGLIIFGIGLNYFKPSPEVRVSHANLIISTSDIPLPVRTSELSTEPSVDTEMYFHGLERGTNWNSR